MSGTAWKRLRLAGLAFVVVAAGLSDKQALAQAAAPPCPVTGQPANAEISTAHRGGKVFFANEEALGKFTADRAKYNLPANLQLVATGQAIQVACPVLGKKLASRQFQVNGIFVCCGGCHGKLSAASPQQFAETCFGTNFEKIFQVRATAR